MTPQDFRQGLSDVGLSQRRLAGILGVSPVTVNRWCDENRPDRIEPPKYAISFIRAWAILTPEQREAFTLD